MKRACILKHMPFPLIWKEYIFVASIVAILNVLFCRNYLISIGITLIEILILMFLLLKNNVINFYCFYSIFSALSMEFEFYVGTDEVYGFRKFDFCGINISVWILLIFVCFLIITRGYRFFKAKYVSRHVYYFCVILFSLFWLSIVTGVVGVLCNDNDIIYLENFKYKFILELYGLMLPNLVSICLVFLVSYKQKFIAHLKYALISILWGIALQIFTSFLFRVYGMYGSNLTLLSSTAIILLPFILIFPYYEINISKTMLALSFLGVFLNLAYSASGKYILTLCLVGFLLIFVLIKNKKYLNICILVFFGIIILIFLGEQIKNVLENNDLFKEKLNQVISMLTFWKENWLRDMMPSPQIRILEIMNTFLEYESKPWFLLFGKGINGSFSDHMELMKFVSDAYTNEEWANNLFIGVHGTFTKLLLVNGLLGVLLYLYTLFLLFKYWRQSIWLVIGVYWFSLFYGYSLSLTMIGFSSLMIGLYDIDLKRNDSYENIVC